MIKENETPVIEWQAELISYLGEYLVQPVPVANDNIVSWARETAKSAIDIHLPSTLSLRSLSFYRTVMIVKQGGQNVTPSILLFAMNL